MNTFSMGAVINLLIIAVVSLAQLIRSAAAFNLQELQIIGTSKASVQYRLDYVEFAASGHDTVFDYGTLRARKYNRTTHVLDGYFDVLTPISDYLTFKVDMFAWQGNEYRKLGEKRVPKFCSFIRDDITVVPTYILRTNVDPNFKCPIPKMRIYFKNLTMPELPPFYILGDRYRINFTIIDAEKIILAKYAAYFVKDT